MQGKHDNRGPREVSLSGEDFDTRSGNEVRAIICRTLHLSAMPITIVSQYTRC